MKYCRIFHEKYDTDTDLCELGLKYGTDKTTLHIYTPFYHSLFSLLRYKPIVFGEIGIYKNQSMKMWRDYFPNAKLYGWDCEVSDKNDQREEYSKDFVESAKMDNLQNTVYDYMDVTNINSIENALKKTETKFDILIDDSDHSFWSQINLIRTVPLFLNPGGMLIIEDVERRNYEFRNHIGMYGHQKFYSDFIEVKTSNPNDNIYIFIRNEVEQ